ncbi:MAG: S1 RNA-binding domain-containing protein [Leptospirales bacterium]
MAASPISFQDSNMTMEELLNNNDLSVTPVKSGDIIQGKIIGFDSEQDRKYIIVSMGTKSEGRISQDEFDQKPQVGDDIEAIVKATDKETGIVFLSQRELEMRRGWEVVEESFDKNLPISGVVKRQVQRGYGVNVCGVNMFLPHSHVGSLLNPGERGKKPPVVNNTFMFQILELDRRKKTGIISRKAFLDGENAEKWEAAIEKIRIGEIVDGKVVKHIKIGAFVEVMGVLGFLHKSNISWERDAGEISAKLPVDTELQCRVLEIDPENHRLSLGLKQMTDDPWTNIGDKFKARETVAGTVSFVANYGAFIDLGEGIEGLLHVSEMSWTRKINHAAEIIKKNQEIQCMVLEVNPGEKRIALGLKQLHENPWDEIRDTIKVGEQIDGKVKDVTHFGVFVAISSDIDGLVRKEDINWDEPAPDPRKMYKSGDDIGFKIIEINLEEQKIGCSVRHTLPNPYKELRQRHKRGSIVDGIISGVVEFGIFVRFEDRYEGLVHKSAMTRDDSDNIKKVYKKGDKIQVVVRSIDPESRKISLSTRDVQYAMERLEIDAYIDKNDKNEIPTSNPFGDLKSVVIK